MRKLFILGFPSMYGGAGAELYHQIHLWRKAFPEIELHIIPTNIGFTNEQLYKEMLDLGVTMEEPMNFSVITKDDAIINFCSKDFLINLEKIKLFTSRIMWSNCMTWLFDLEKLKAHKDIIRFYLYQRPQVRDDHQKELEKLGASGHFIHFVPYFESSMLDFSVNHGEKINLGRISRSDADKFSRNTLHIYEYIVSPKFKQGRFLGWNDKLVDKIGKPYEWIKTYTNQHELPVKDFYKLTDIIVQPTDTTENWPRIGFEAMYSGKPLLVDNRGGWQYMIDHGVNGFLCDSPRDFIYWGSRLCYEPELREKIATNALEKAKSLSSFEVSKESWKQVFEKVYA